jgi:hypothetical protein
MKDVNPVLPDSMKIGEEGLMGEDGVVPGAELDLAARSVIDSTYIVDVPQDTTQAAGDSLYVISKDKEVRLLKYNTPDSAVYDETSGRYVAKTPKYGVADVRFNVEQDNYMWYLRNNLVLPDVRLSQLAQSEQKKEAKKKDKKEKKGFFKNLFKRKKKDEVDSTAITIPPKPEDDFDYIDEEEQTQATEQIQEEPQKKKGLFKKKDKAQEPEAEVGPEEQKPAKEKKKKKEKKPKIDNGDTPKEQEEEEDDDGF